MPSANVIWLYVRSRKIRSTFCTKKFTLLSPSFCNFLPLLFANHAYPPGCAGYPFVTFFSLFACFIPMQSFHNLWGVFTKSRVCDFLPFFLKSIFCHIFYPSEITFPQRKYKVFLFVFILQIPYLQPNIKSNFYYL